ncbi:MAG: AMP-binding protein [Verrucomicrobia bacterium]|nr:AMP-binding protein [Verrucomicrobiota bacterium]
MEQVLCPISENALSTPHRTALISDERRWSYLELDQALHSLCLFLSEAGIKEHQRIAFIAKCDPATILLFLALFRLRAIACPLSFRTPQQQIAKQLSELKASHVLEPATLPHSSGQCAQAPTMISLNSPATFLFTSGSSGTPKIACHSFANHYYNALGALLPLRLDSTSRYLLSLPLFHVSGIGILFRCFQKGAAVVVSDHPVQDAISRYSISHLSVVPTQLQRLLSEPLSSLKCILLGGAPLSPTLLQQSRHLPVFTTYGMTEMSSIITLSDGKSEPHSGKAPAFREMKIEKDGEIWVKGKTLFLGYWDASSETILKADVQGWFPTKDLGRVDRQGNLELIGRKDRLFISGGENIQPEEIERALCAIPGIIQAAVIPVSDPEFGHRPVAFINDASGRHTLLSIREELKPLLPSFKHPVRILPLPSDAGLKPNLGVLKQQLVLSQESPSGNQE